MQGWKVGVAYERYGYIEVSKDEAKTEKEAIEVAKKKLENMDRDELESITEYLPFSEEIDEEAVIDEDLFARDNEDR